MASSIVATAAVVGWSADSRDAVLKTLSSWSVTSRPAWRAQTRPLSEQMLADISRISRWYTHLPSYAVDWCERSFVRRSAINWVYASNVLDHVGVQSLIETAELLQQVFVAQDSKADSSLRACPLSLQDRARDGADAPRHAAPLPRLPAE